MEVWIQLILILLVLDLTPLACFKLDMITLEELAEVVWQWYKALDPGVF